MKDLIAPFDSKELKEVLQTINVKSILFDIVHLEKSLIERNFWSNQALRIEERTDDGD